MYNNAVRGNQTKKEKMASNKAAHHTLKIVRQPPGVFANQQRGRKHGFVVQVEMQGPKLTSANLKVDLVYADTLQKVPDKKPKKLGLKSAKRRRPNAILHLFGPTNAFSSGGEASFRARINDVSRNHFGRRFRLCLSAFIEDNAVTSTYTTPIKVISKHPKVPKSLEGHSDALIPKDTPCASLAPHAASTEKVVPRKRQRSPSGENTTDESVGSLASQTEHARHDSVRESVAVTTVDWETRAFAMIKSSEKHVIGHTASNRAITQCPCCFRTGDSRQIEHAAACELSGVLNSYSSASTKTHSKSSSSSSSSSSHGDDSDGE